MTEATGGPCSSHGPCGRFRRFTLFSGLSEADAASLAPAIRRVTFAAGEPLFSEGDAASGFYLVLEGAVKIFKLSPAGTEQVLHVVPPGQSFAEAAMVHGTTYPASAEAVRASTLLYVERGAFLQALRSSPELSLRIMQSLAEKLRRMVRLVEELSLRDARGRMCRYLLSRSPAPGEEIDIPVSQALLGRQLGTSAETVSRVLAGLKKEGILEGRGRNRFVLVDLPALREAAEGLPADRGS